MKIFILGSCVTRDAFHSKNNEGFDLIGYQARYSLSRISFPGLSIKNELLEKNLSSVFQQKMLYAELSNNILATLKQLNFDYLIVDCIDERFGLIEYEDTFVTNSTELRKSKIIDNPISKKTFCKNNEFFSLWEKGLTKILEDIPVQKIIINNVLWAEKDNNNYPFSEDKKVIENNNFLHNLYSIARKYIAEQQFVNYPADMFISDVHHKWGPAPYHYTSDIYEYLKENLKSRVIK